MTMQNTIASVMMIPVIPPSTPPTMAPTSELDEPDELDGELPGSPGEGDPEDLG